MDWQVVANDTQKRPFYNCIVKNYIQAKIEQTAIMVKKVGIKLPMTEIEICAIIGSCKTGITPNPC